MSSPAQEFSAHLLAGLVEGGVRQIFIAPGARSQALAIAAGQLSDSGKVTLRVRIDERSMGFTALGAAKITQEPVVVITTSGTAVANLHPAVLEAHHSGVPIILLTADRPEELRGVGANQTTNQVGIFSDAVRACFDVLAPVGTEEEKQRAVNLSAEAINIATGSSSNRPGPVQINLCFREPLSSLAPDAAKLEVRLPLTTAEIPVMEFAEIPGKPNTVVIAGAEAGPEAIETAEAFGWPIFAEPSSRARFGSNAIPSYRALLEENSNLAGGIERVIVFGKPTLSRQVIALLKKTTVEVIVVRSKNMGYFDVSLRASAQVDDVSVIGEPSHGWLEAWRQADIAWKQQQGEAQVLNRRKIVELVWEATEFDDLIVLGASRMIREADLWAPAKGVQVFSNRGLAGIDGTIATATGIALNAENAFTRALIGDLTLLHDATSMVHDSTEKFNLQLVVVNDGGGSIFENLEMAKTLDTKTFDKLFRTPQNFDLWSLANTFGFAYILTSNAQELESALRTQGRVLIEIKL